MVTLAVVDEQLKAVGCHVRNWGWGRAEVRELCEILLPGETIAAAVNGQYEGGFSMLVATDFRVLLIDKKPKYLTLRDVRFDMITELDFSARMMDSTVHIYTPNREIRFKSYNGARLRKLFQYTQHKVMEIRHHFMMQQFQQQQLANNTPPGLAMAQQRYAEAIDVKEVSASSQPLPPTQSQPSQPSYPQDSIGAGHQHGIIDSSEEQLKLAAAMGAAGLRSIVHNGKVIKDYMAVPFTQRWRKRPYGYTNAPITGQPQA